MPRGGGGGRGGLKASGWPGSTSTLRARLACRWLLLSKAGMCEAGPGLHLASGFCLRPNSCKARARVAATGQLTVSAHLPLACALAPLPLQVMGCGLNMPSPDLLTPVRAAAAIWTWAPGHPFDPSYGDDAQLGKLVLAAGSNRGGEPSSSSSSGGGGVGSSGVQAPAANCGVISAADSRWRAVPCSLPTLPSACRDRNASLGAPDGGWVVDASLPRGDCPPGTQYDLPRHPRENYLLAAALQRGGHDAAWLPVHGPEWSTDGWPAERQQRQPTDKRRVLRHVGLPAAAGLLAVAALVSGVVLSRRLWLRRQHGGLYQALASG